MYNNTIIATLLYIKHLYLINRILIIIIYKLSFKASNVRFKVIIFTLILFNIR